MQKSNESHSAPVKRRIFDNSKSFRSRHCYSGSAWLHLKHDSATCDIKMEEKAHIFGLRTTANREEQVMDFVTSKMKKLPGNVYAIIRAQGMRGYVFVE